MCLSAGGSFLGEYICQLTLIIFFQCVRCHKEFFLCVLIAVNIIQIPGSVFGVMISVYSIHFKPINRLNAVCFLHICDDTNLYCSK